MVGDWKPRDSVPGFGPGPGAVHLQQQHPLFVDGIFRRQVEGHIFPVADVLRNVAGPQSEQVNRAVEPDIAVEQEGLYPFEQVDAGDEVERPGADGVLAQELRG